MTGLLCLDCGRTDVHRHEPLAPGFYRGGHSEVGEPDGFTIVEDVPFCDCTNEQLEHGSVCAQAHCPNRPLEMCRDCGNAHPDPAECPPRPCGRCGQTETFELVSERQTITICAECGSDEP